MKTRLLSSALLLLTLLAYPGTSHAAESLLVERINRLGFELDGTVVVYVDHSRPFLCADVAPGMGIVLPNAFPHHEEAVAILLGAHLSNSRVHFTLEKHSSTRCRIVAFNTDTQ